MDIRKLQRAIVDGLEDVKALDIQVYNTEHLSPLFERVIIASGQSNRQTKALAASVRDAVKSRDMSVLRTEGEENGEWIIVDCGAAVAHIMQPSIREYYRLEEIWGGKPVKMKLGAAGGGLVKASEPMDEEDDEPAAKPKAKPAKASVEARPAKAQKQPVGVKKPAAAKSTSTRGPAVKPAAKKAAPSAAKRAAAKPAAKKTAGQPRPAPSTVRTAAGRAALARPAAPAKAPSSRGATSSRTAAPAGRGASSTRGAAGKTTKAASTVKKIVAPVKGARSAAAKKPATPGRKAPKR
jgi:ribosome-associated protein